MYRSGETGPIIFLDIETPKSGMAPHSGGKRRNSHINQVSANDETIPLTPTNSSQKRAKTSSVSSFTSKSHSMKNILDPIKSQGSTLGEFLYRLFRRKDDLPEPVRLVAVRYKCGEGGEQDALDQGEVFRTGKAPEEAVTWPLAGGCRGRV
ncbi:hypothetical protein B0H17DRAFT_1142199 [Mycena rosella]|uniref:Uncharacterized protein n=1 Tax=Mycena rosella TaxID=1033263 RepID=A0AAD7CYC3_MYCRO|nr:hypothetical protein B0H17DRAFT_1142199 [Mycena rosella]